MQLSESKTLENLKTAFANESAAMVRYEIFAEKAKQNGDEEISQVFRTTARNEKAHAQIWLGLIYGGIPEAADALEKAMHGETVWLCRNCGHIHCGSTPPEYCPVCRKPQGYFQRKDDSILS